MIDVLRSDWLTQGPAVDVFEHGVARYCGAGYAVCTNSATSALHIACLAAGLGPGDILWTSPNTFVASANCALYCGAEVDFVDIDERTYNMSVERLEQKLEASKRTGQLPKVVIPVHFAGQSCDMLRISELARSYGFTVIEDASHAIGGGYHGKKIGSCQYSDMTIFSFHPVKIITTGEGGMIVTNNREFHEKLTRLRSHGITRNPDFMQGRSHGPWYYQQIELGFNYRMTDIQAALGTSQLARLDEFVARRHYLAERYNTAFSDVPVTVPWQHPDCYSAHHLYVIRLQKGKISSSHKAIFEKLRSTGVQVNLHYIPVPLQPYYQQLGFKAEMFAEAINYYGEALSIPMYFDLTDEQQDYVIAQVRGVVQ